jgi:hypothetical protein
MTLWEIPYRLGNYTGGTRPFRAPLSFTGHETQEDWFILIHRIEGD